MRILPAARSGRRSETRVESTQVGGVIAMLPRRHGGQESCAALSREALPAAHRTAASSALEAFGAQACRKHAADSPKRSAGCGLLRRRKQPYATACASLRRSSFLRSLGSSSFLRSRIARG